MIEHRSALPSVADGGVGVPCSPHAASAALPTIVCIHCDRLVRLGNHLVSHGLCDGCRREFLLINGVEVAA